MRYIKVLLLVLVFFLSMIFFFQNQEALSKEMVLKLNLFFTPPMASIPLPFYFLVLASFLLGSFVAFIALVWDKMHLSARHMKATWRVRTLEKEVTALKAVQEPAPKSASIFSRKSAAKPAASGAVAPTAVSGAASVPAIEDMKASDPDKQA